MTNTKITEIFGLHIEEEEEPLLLLLLFLLLLLEAGQGHSPSHITPAPAAPAPQLLE